MLASSSRHALNACTRASVSRRSARAVSSAWKASSAPVSVGIRNATTQVQSASEHDDSKPKPPFRNSRVASRPAARVWEFRQDKNVFKITRGAQSTQYNMAMRDFLARQEVDKVVDLVGKMKRTNVRPDVSTYNNLINALALEYMHQDAWAVFRDMTAMKIQPDTNTFNQLLFAHSNRNSDSIFNVLKEMDKHGVKPNARTYDFIVKYYLDGDNLEMALCKLAEMNDLGFSPSLRVAQLLIDAAGQAGHVRLALDLADAYEETTVRRLDSETWVNMLVHSAEQLYADGVMRSWKKVVTDLHILLDEGLCQLVLHTAARHGLPILASDAIKQLEAIGVQFQEHHFAPMLDAFVKNQQLKEAFCVLDLMRTAKADPTIDSAHSILQSIRHDPELIDNAYAVLEEIHKEGLKVDIIAVNTLIKASATLNDLQRAVGIYKAMPSLGVQPDSETFEILLKACRSARHFELGERLLGEMREAGLSPTAKTFERLISLVLTQADYENAFFYLEQLKGAGFTPSYSVYEDIVKKCVSAGDIRFKLAVEELEQMGYKVSGRLRNFIDSGGQEWKDHLSDAERLPYETRKRMKEMNVWREEAVAV